MNRKCALIPFSTSYRIHKNIVFYENPDSNVCRQKSVSLKFPWQPVFEWYHCLAMFCFTIVRTIYLSWKCLLNTSLNRFLCVPRPARCILLAHAYCALIGYLDSPQLLYNWVFSDLLPPLNMASQNHKSIFLLTISKAAIAVFSGSIKILYSSSFPGNQSVSRVYKSNNRSLLNWKYRGVFSRCQLTILNILAS